MSCLSTPMMSIVASRPSGVDEPGAAVPLVVHTDSVVASGSSVSLKNGRSANRSPKRAVASPNTSPQRDTGTWRWLSRSLMRPCTAANVEVTPDT